MVARLNLEATGWRRRASPSCGTEPRRIWRLVGFFPWSSATVEKVRAICFASACRSSKSCEALIFEKQAASDLELCGRCAVHVPCVLLHPQSLAGTTETTCGDEGGGHLY